MLLCHAIKHFRRIRYGQIVVAVHTAKWVNIFQQSIKSGFKSARFYIIQKLLGSRTANVGQIVHFLHFDQLHWGVFVAGIITQGLADRIRCHVRILTIIIVKLFVFGI